MALLPPHKMCAGPPTKQLTVSPGRYVARDAATVSRAAAAWHAVLTLGALLHHAALLLRLDTSQAATCCVCMAQMQRTILPHIAWAAAGLAARC